MFVNSIHEFDDESAVFNIIAEMNVKYDDLPLNNFFQSDSKSSKLIQISDIVVGLLAKLTDIVVASTFDELVTAIDALNPVQCDNYKKFIAIVDKSNEFNKALFQFSMADADRRKLAWLGL